MSGSSSSTYARTGAGRASAITPIERRRLRVLLVADVLAPGDGAATLVRLLNGDVRHQPRGRGAVPVVLARLEEDAVAGADDLDRAAFTLAQADALGDPDRLAVRVDVPRGARAGREVDCGRTDGRCVARRGDRVDVDGTGEPVAWAGTRVERVACDLHVSFSFD